MDERAPVCERCGVRRSADDPAALAWVHEREAGDGSDTWLCPACARRHLRDIEARLDRAWW